jgi:hypothetical protein
VSAQNAKDAADDFVALFRLSAESKGGKFQLVTFASDEDCRFFYPRRALDWQRQVNTYISRALRERGIRVRRIALTPADYHTWRGDRSDGPDTRRAFADQHLRLLD